MNMQTSRLGLFANLGAVLGLWVSLGVASQNAIALDNFTPGDLSDLQQTNIDELIKLVALGANHRPYNSARPLGMAIGLDVGIDLTAISVPEEFKTALAFATDNSPEAIPSLIPLPKLTIQKGFPAGIDLSFSYISYQESFIIYGLGAQWAFLKKSPVLPNASVRFNASYTKLWFIQARNFAIDGIISKKFSVIDPYAGFGIQIWNGNLSVPAGSLASSLSSSTSGVSPHLFVGLPINLVFLKFVGEFDYNFSGVTSYGGKFALSF